MKTQISKISELKEHTSAATVFDKTEQLSPFFLTENENIYLKNKNIKGTEVVVYRYPIVFFFQKINEQKNTNSKLELARKSGATLFGLLKKENIQTIQLINFSNPKLMLPFIEGLLLASYSFSKYKKEKESFLIKEIQVFDKNTSEEAITELQILSEAVFFARNLVNEPLSYLTALKLSEEIQEMGSKSGCTVEIFQKQKIKSLKMGGLLAVNKGSIDPPTFTVIEWKPKNQKNTKPIVLVGKGVVYDTGGLSLKPTPNSMDFMKSDMGGAAVVAATISAIAKAKIPIHVIGLIPATDNRPDGNAYVPGDIITMFDGTSVEIKNTDAEGRLLLADGLSYAKKYNPELVIDIATLTGSAMLITGKAGIVGMGNSKNNIDKLKISGEEVFERIVELPLWDEFAEPLKSNVADLNNLGVREGQTSIAGKFLEHFTDYPWIHLDIAGTAFISEDDSYKPKGGTGSGIRLLFNFLKRIK
jgi:leucyl aminopeptidase